MPNPPDIQDGEETESNISSDASAPNKETDEQRMVGRERTKHDRFNTTVPATARKSGNGKRKLVVTSSNGAWLRRQLTNNACTMKKHNDSAEIVML
jgi:hypothetical protein